MLKNTFKGTVVLFVITTLFFVVAIEKPRHLTSPPADEITYTTVALLRDSIPASLLAPLQLEHVKGIKIQWNDGRYRCFFRYTADTTRLLDAIERIPFSIYGNQSDVGVRPLSALAAKETWAQLRHENVNNDFFSAVEGYEVQSYVCNKSPFTHTLIIHPQTHQVFHCVEFSFS